MKKDIIKLLLLTTCFFTTIGIKAQGDTVIPKSEVQKAIGRFVKLVDSQDVQNFGVQSIAELQSLKPGVQFKKYVIGLNDVKKYKQGDDVKKIIKEYPSVEVALVNGAGKIRTSIEFVKNNGTWEASAYGSSPELTLLRSEQATIGQGIIDKGKLIRIPALQISFITVESTAAGGGVRFLPLGNPQKYKLIKGEKIVPSVAILKLVPYANKHNGLPN